MLDQCGIPNPQTLYLDEKDILKHMLDLANTQYFHFASVLHHIFRFNVI
jgi:hypothetical protein